MEMNILPKEINIKIHSLGFNDYDNFKVSPYITVEELKKIVCNKNDFPLTTIRLLFKGKSLIPSSSIYDYGITEGDMLYAVPAARIPPQYLPISFNITIQSNQPVVYHYRPDTRDFDRQINTMRVRIAEIQEACSSALLRISLTQHLLTRRDNPKSTKIPRAIIPSSGPIRTSEAETSNSSLNQNLPSPSINTIDLSLLSDKEKMKRYEHGCRIVQGKLLEALKAISTNVTSLKQYKVMENHGEMGAVFTREGPLPEPPTLTRDLLIGNVTNGLGELFGAPGSNLVPTLFFHFPDDQDNNSQNNNTHRNNTQHTASGINDNNGNSNNQTKPDQIISPPTSQLFSSHMSPSIPSEITNAVVQQAHSQVSMKPENQIKNNQNNHQFDDFFDHHRHRRHRHRHHSGRSSRHHPFFGLNADLNFLNSDSDSSSSSNDSNESNNNTNKRRKKRNLRSSPFNDDSNPLSNFIRMHRNRIRRMRSNEEHNHNRDNSESTSTDNDHPSIQDLDNLLNFFNDEDNEFTTDSANSNNESKDDQINDTNNNDDDNNNDNNNNDNDNDNNNNDNDNDPNNNLLRFFTQDEIDQLNNDKKMIEEEAENGTIPNINPEFYQTRVLDGY